MKAEKTTYNDKYYISKFRGRTTEDQILKHATELKEKRSITPDTHKSRTLVEDIEELAKFGLIEELKIVEKQVTKENSMLQKEESDSKFYVDEYQYKENAVIRFGINKYCNGLKEALDIHNLKQIEISGKKLETLSNISQETKYKEFSGLIQLTTLEQEILTYAITYLKGNSIKTTLVDLFPRGTKTSDKGMINIPKDDEPVDTHTVVLYNTGKKILIIDPNNPQFSAHLANFDPLVLEATYTPNNLYKIYSRPEGSKTGFASDKFRDCIDIAVKLAFGLNSDVSSYENLLDLIKSQTVKFITNNTGIDKFFPDIKNITLRSKQSSDLEIVKNKNKIFEILWNKKIEAEKHQLLTFNPIIKSIQESLKLTQDKLQESINYIKNDYEQELSGLDSNYFDNE
jgi:hypothetical protein